MRWIAIVICAAACTPRAVTPPSRTFVMDSPSAPEVGHKDVQVDGSLIGTMWGPELVNANARLRYGVEHGVSVEADGGVLNVTNAGDGGDRNAYTGRLGVLRHDTESRHWAIGAGIGGGVSPTAGSWGTADIHGVLSGAHRYARPMLGAGLAYSAPFGDRTFEVRESDGTPTTLRLPRNVIAQVHMGLELGPPDQAFIIGASMIRFWLRDDSVVSETSSTRERDEIFVAFGVGLRIGLD